MKANHRANHRRAFTMVELIIVILAILVLLGLLLPALAQKRQKAHRISCVGGLKSTALGMKIFASDNNDRYPYQVRPPLTNATALETIGLTNAIPAGPASPTFPGRTQQAAWAHWGTMSNELGSPRMLLCRGDRTKKLTIATDWTTRHMRGFYSELGHRRMTGSSSHLLDRPDYGAMSGYDTSISYFISFDADEKIPVGILAGFFNLQWNGRAAQPHRTNPRGAGNQVVSGAGFTNLTWATGAGGDGAWALHGREGNLALTDGSVAQVTSEQLQKAFRDSTNAWGKNTMHLLIPR